MDDDLTKRLVDASIEAHKEWVRFAFEQLKEAFAGARPIP